ncbi:Hemolysin-type calcium-binding repeat-containing protein [Jannaschia faecimaris]|uniref:Hemolysin-type calcium-binding repeat-containing protein n=1 Tax=Jannaschia faecimaris TaxID=1244108 RepID=A0A1H3T2Y3_9RHOB|nr:calcium-binding protein [Jannaschia faecimaris]SDZ44095.1 Hemolysin-type calcium-binding repeat-containing protein [Jannaschia faecimaris]
MDELVVTDPSGGGSGGLIGGPGFTGTWIVFTREGNSFAPSPADLIAELLADNSGSDHLHIINELAGYSIVESYPVTAAGRISNGTDIGDAQALDGGTIQFSGGGSNDIAFATLGSGGALAGGGGDDILSGALQDDELSGGDRDDTVTSGGGDDLVDGGAGADVLLGGLGNGVFMGGAGDGDLFGGAGNDTLNGGEGHDFLFGGAGDDSFVFRSVFGNDIIFDLSVIDGDVIDLIAIEGLTSIGQLLLEEVDGNSILAGSGTATFIPLDLDQDGVADDDQSITVLGTTASELTIDAFNFAINTTPAVPTQVGTAGDDNIAGTNNDDVIHGGTGNDTIVGNLGDDHIIYSGGDDFIGRSNRGNDTLDLSAYAATDVTFSIAGHDVLIETPDGTIELEYQVRYELGNAQSNIKEIVFADGTLDAAGIQGRALADQGTVGDDFVTGSYQDDTIISGLGDDTIRSNSGDDLIVYEGGNDFVHR